jgi:hypothetical protein
MMCTSLSIDTHEDGYGQQPKHVRVLCVQELAQCVGDYLVYLKPLSQQ